MIKYLTEEMKLDEKQQTLLHGFFVAWETYATHMKNIALLTQDDSDDLHTDMTHLVKKRK